VYININATEDKQELNSPWERFLRGIPREAGSETFSNRAPTAESQTPLSAVASIFCIKLL